MRGNIQHSTPNVEGKTPGLPRKGATGKQSRPASNEFNAVTKTPVAKILDRIYRMNRMFTGEAETRRGGVGGTFNAQRRRRKRFKGSVSKRRVLGCKRAKRLDWTNGVEQMIWGENRRCD
jgi:hypothetical protein